MKPLKFERTPAQVRAGYKLVRVDVAALDRGLAATPGYHVGPGGAGPSAIKGRYPEAKAFIARSRAAGTPIHAPEGGVDRKGRPFLDDGRHRFAALRDQGETTVEIAVPRGQAARFGRLFGGGGAAGGGGAGVGGGGKPDPAFNQPLRGLIEPDSPSWRSAGPPDRLAFYREAGPLAVKEKRRELALAIGSNGRRMKPRKHPRSDGADGPVLTPHDEDSRTSRLLAARAFQDGLTLFWHSGISKGTRKAWGVILGYHARGQVRGAPVRDVRLSKRGIGVVKRAMARWWADRQAKLDRQRESSNADESASSVQQSGFFGRVKSAVKGAFTRLKKAFTPNPKPKPTIGPPLSTRSEDVHRMAERYPSLKPYLRDKDGKPLS